MSFPFPVFNPSSGGNDAFTKLLLHFEGADASTTFTDSSLANRTGTVNGNAQIDTAQFKFGAASGLFDGTGDFVTYPDHADLDFGTGALTIECWIRIAVTGSQLCFLSKGTGANPGQWRIQTLAGDQVRFLSNTTADGSVVLNTTTTIGTGAWHHVAVTRSGNTLRLFLDGTEEDSDTITDALDNAVALSVGSNNASSSIEFNGWIDEVRISKGIARWTANFTPPTAPYS